MSVSNCLRPAWKVALCSTALLLSTCGPSHQESSPSKPQTVSQTNSDERSGPWVNCDSPYGTELNETFTIACSLHAPANTKPVHVTADADQRVQYSRKKFDLKPGRVEVIEVKVLQAKSGIATLVLRPDGQDSVEIVVDVGFQGHLKLVPNVTISSDSPTTASVAIVDDNGKPLAVGIKLQIYAQAVGAQLRWGQKPGSDETGWQETLSPTILSAKSSVSPQFQIRPTGKLGGTIQLLVNLQFPNNEAMLAQETFLIPVKPARYWPIIFAAGGSLLFWLYSFVQAPKGGRAVTFQILAALFGGVIAYLFAGFDLLGLKLDPNVLKTYVILGFLFGYVGIEVLLANRFKPKGTAEATPTPGATPTPKVTTGATE